MDFECPPPELHTLPKKSKERYELKYQLYCTWKTKNNAEETSESVFIAYLTERSKHVNPASLFAEHSMLKTMIKLRENVDVHHMARAQGFLKQNSEHYIPKQSRTLTHDECMKFLKDAPNNKYLMNKVAMIIGVYGACRKCELINLRLEDLEINDDYLVVNIPQTHRDLPRTFTIPNSHIDGIQMAALVKRYIALRPAHTPHKRLFVYYSKGKCTTNPIGKNAFAAMPASIAQYLNLPDAKLYTGHCFRRTSATLLANAGANAGKIREHGGWKSSTVAEGYIDDSLINKINISHQILRSSQPVATVTSNANVEKTYEEMNYEAQFPGSSSSSPSVQDIVMSALRTMEPKEEEGFEYAENDERISLILNKKFSFLQEQLPLTIATGDYQVMKEIIENGDVFRDATLRTKVHCTMCDMHLGASPIAQFGRFVHPVLNALLCESCCMSYNEREFLKDEDGIEMYCKWCAQDGTVMCCSDCPLVFCKLCVDRNFGERVWEKIANADTWQCFKCNPSQLSKLQIMCTALHEYTLKTIKYAIQMGDKHILEKDISICCKEDSTTINKRKHIVLDDEVDLEDIPNALRKRMKVCHDLTPTFPATSIAQNVLSFSDASNINTPVQRILLPKIPLSTSPQLLPLVPNISLPFPSQCMDISQDQAPLKPGMPVITSVEGNVVLPTLPSTKESNTKTENRTSKYVFLKNTLHESQEAIDTFTRECESLHHALNTANSDAQYAELQSSMQDALYKCVNILLKTRNVLTSSNANHKQVPKKVPVCVPAAANKTAVTSVDGAAGKKSTIISQNYVPDVLKTIPSRPNNLNQVKRVMPMPPRSQPPILLRPTLTPVTVRTTQNAINTNSAIITTGLKPVLMNQIQPANTLRHVTSNVKNNPIVISQGGSKNNMYDKHVNKTADKDPLAMSDDESEGSCIKTEIDIFDEPITIKVEEDET